jgi:hypothetical protein
MSHPFHRPYRDLPQNLPLTIGRAAASAIVATPVITADPAPPPAAPTLPLVGEPWPGQGGTFVGVVRSADGTRNCALIVAEAEPPQLLNWDDSMAWAQAVEADGHKDFTLPTREESPLLYAVLGAPAGSRQVVKGWHWTSTQYSDDYAYLQYFGYGYQGYDVKSFKAEARAVRRLPL